MPAQAEESALVPVNEASKRQSGLPAASQQPLYKTVDSMSKSETSYRTKACNQSNTNPSFAKERHEPGSFLLQFSQSDCQLHGVPFFLILKSAVQTALHWQYDYRSLLRLFIIKRLLASITFEAVKHILNITAVKFNLNNRVSSFWITKWRKRG